MRPSVIRPIASAIIIGVSTWCAAGRLTVSAPDPAAVRLGVPASPWWFVLAAAAALLVPAWRRRPGLAAPALIATVPWWPVALPVPLLLWTGPLAWLPIGLALACGIMGSRADAGSTSTALPAAAGPPSRPAILAGVLTLAAAVVVATVVDVRTPGGDEPHYLIITQSLLSDGDLRIENNHRDGDYAEYYGGTIQPDFIQRGADGEIYSIHAPGVSVLVAPGFAAFGYRGAQATVLAASALAGALIWLIGWHTSGRADGAWFAWAAVTLTPTFLLQAGMIFPDAPGALAVAAGAWLIVRLSPNGAPISLGALAAAGALLAALPWLHTRFAVIALGLGVLVTWRLWQRRSRRGAALAAFLAVPVAAALAWFAFFWMIYGTPNPAAPYGSDSGARLAYVPGGVFALLFDSQFGLLAYSPVLAAAGLGLWVARQSPERTAARAACLVAALYACAVATYWMWWAGLPATPARFLTAILPLAALPLGLTWSVARAGMRQALSVLLLISIAITAITIGAGEGGGLAWNTRDAQARWLEWLGPVVSLPRAWPSFFWRLDPGDLMTELPFVGHAIWFALVIATGFGLALAGSSSRSARRGVAMLGMAWALPAALTIAAYGGWRMNDVSGLAPSRSQLAVAGLIGRGLPVWRLAGGRVERETSPARVLRIRGQEPGRTDIPPPWAVFLDVPPGLYEVVVLNPTRAGGLLDIRLGRSTSVLASVPVSGAGDPKAPLLLPAGARVLTVDPAEPAPAIRGIVELRPAVLDREAKGLAHTFARYEAADVFFLDDGVFAETPGFWVRGGMAAAFMVSPPPHGPPLELRVQNGTSPNAVEIAIDGSDETITLEPSEARQIPLRSPSAENSVHVRVRSPSGFRPSDAGLSEDRRFLGVWIAIDTREEPPLP